ncbi:MAG: ribonuclease HII [Candidatus Nomurabacteria bacterium]|jgi:ribonuclease HII|nr:ribonuclease HII [Candidatus Nomurabacteria bacterium]
MAILGIDEVGRGAWAGPLVVGAVVLAESIDGLADSKKLTKKRREELTKQIKASGAGIGLGWVSAAKLDEIGLSEALKLATRRAVEQVKVPYHEITIDGTINFLAGTNKSDFVTTLKKADQLISSVSAASIVAKVARDAYMAELEAKYPGYGFAEHVGYGTAAHRKALAKFGATSEHRMSFKPLGAVTAKTSGIKTTKKLGDAAEEKVAAWLEQQGYKIVARNWKTKLCEIDIVAEKDKKLYFVEVKYRKNSEYGSGLEVITPKKQTQMAFASEVFTNTYSLVGVDKCLAAVDVTGESNEIRDFRILS